MNIKKESASLLNIKNFIKVDPSKLKNFQKIKQLDRDESLHFKNQKKIILEKFLKRSDIPQLIEESELFKNKKNKTFDFSTKNSFLTGYSKIHELKLITIGLASSEKIQQWAEKVLPNGKILGEITNANTLHYKTFKPTKGGLFCERIFGPLKDFECACGIKQKPSFEDSEKILDHLETKRKFCDICDVEYTWSVIRRYQLGYIQLISPVSHLWYLKANPSYLSILLDVKKKKLESIIYCTETTTLENVWKTLHNYGFDSSPSFIYLSWKELLNEEKKSKITVKKTNLIVSNKLHRKLQDQNNHFPKKLKAWSLTKASTVKLFCYTNQKNPLFGEDLKNNNLYQKFEKQIEQKIKLKEKKFIINRIWKKVWSSYLKKAYLISLNHNSFIWTTLWFLFLNNQNYSSLINDFSLEPVEEILSLKKIIFLKENQIFDLLNLTDKRKVKKNLKAIKSNFLIKKTINPFFIQIKSNLTFKELLNKNVNFSEKKIFVNQSEDSTYSNFSLNSFNFQSKIKNSNLDKTINEIIKNYTLVYFLSYLKNEKETINWNEKINTITNLKLKTKFLQKLNFELLNGLSIFQKITIFSLIRFQLRAESDLLTRLKKLIKNCFNLCSKLEIGLIQIKKLKIITHSTKSLLEHLNIYTTQNEIKNCENLYYFLDLKNFFGKKNLINFQNQKCQNLCKTLQKSKVDSISSQKSNFYMQKGIFKIPNLKLKTTSSIKKIQVSKFKIKPFEIQVPSKSSFTHNIYCISYFYTWDVEREWKYFSYYISSNCNFVDSQIPYYKNRTLNLSELTIQNSITGASLIQRLLVEFNSVELKKISKQHQILLPRIRKKIRKLKSLPGKLPKINLTEIEKLLKKRDHILRRLKIIRQLIRKNTNPMAMILSKLPVLPPDLRPILKLEDQIAASDLNTLYQRIIFRNDRLKKFLKDPAISQSFESKYAQRLLQEAVDNLIQNGKGNVKPETNSRGQALKSLSEILKGKQGRFRQYLLGKRVDYSGRSVIVVGPKLKLHECGLPKEMALELFLPFLIKRILHYKLAATIIGAKSLIKSQQPIIWEFLSEIMQNHPVLLNRAPTLHRLGIQAFQPKLIEGRAILIHPLVCPAFNADFDGDQMAVHVPMTVEARIETWKLMFSGNNLISPATGEPIVLPSQDMVLGCYYLTTEKFRFQQIQKRKMLKSQKEKDKFFNLHSTNYFSNNFLPTDFVFNNTSQVLKAYHLNLLNLHSSIWLTWNGFVEMKVNSMEPIELQINSKGYVEEIQTHFYRRFHPKLFCLHQIIKTTPGRVLFNKIIHNYFNLKKKH